MNTLDTNYASKYGGSVMIDLLEKYPEMVVLWAGYSFSKEYNQARGHAHAINDIRNILRTGGVQESPQPATCWTCKSTDVPRLMNEMGTANFYKSEWFDLGVQVINPIGCQDCHDPETMNLRITRPAPVEALRVLGTSIQKGEEARRMLAVVFVKHGVKYPVQLPDISTKKKAQEFVGLEIDKLKKDKDELLKTVVVKWDEDAKKRQGSLIEYKPK